MNLITLQNSRGTRAVISTWGATLVQLLHGQPPTDLVLGFDDASAYRGEHPYFGATIGRFANRIAHGRFTLGGITYTLPINHGAHSLHGGSRGFDKVEWQARPLARDSAAEFTYISEDGEEGYPGTLTARVRYALSQDDVLRLEYEATTDRATIVNLTNHSYFDLSAGQGILEHELWVDADRFTPVDDGLIPTGELRGVAGTLFDFRTPQIIGQRIADGLRVVAAGTPAEPQMTMASGGYDHNFVLNGARGALRHAATLRHPASGRLLEVHTTAEGLQVYTGTQLDGTIRGKGGRVYQRHAAICLETQRFPDAPNHPEFPSAVLRAGERFHGITEYRIVDSRSRKC